MLRAELAETFSSCLAKDSNYLHSKECGRQETGRLARDDDDDDGSSRTNMRTMKVRDGILEDGKRVRHGRATV